MGKNSQNVIISTDGMRSVMNIIKKKNTKRLQMVALNVLDVFTAARQSHISHLRIMVEAKRRSCAVPAGNY